MTHIQRMLAKVFGAGQPLQRCRNHTVRNVLNELTKEQHGQALHLIRAASKVKTAAEGAAFKLLAGKTAHVPALACGEPIAP